jgi:hypothetical protein
MTLKHRYLLPILLLLCVVAASLPALVAWRSERQLAVIKAEVEALGGQLYAAPPPEATFGYWTAVKQLFGTEQPATERAYFVGLADCEINDEWLPRLLALPHLEEIWLSDTRITDRGIAILSELRQLRKLHLEGTNVTDGCLSDLSMLAQLELLDLSHTKVTDACFADLSTLPNLEHLILSYTEVTGEHIDVLLRSPQLRFLGLSGAWNLTAMWFQQSSVHHASRRCLCDAQV